MLPPSEWTLFNSFMLTFLRIEDKLMELTERPDTDTPPNLGEPEEPSPEFQESQEVEPVDQDKPLSEIWLEKVECSPQSRPIEDGTEKSILNKRDTPPLQPLPLLELLH